MKISEITSKNVYAKSLDQLAKKPRDRQSPLRDVLKGKQATDRILGKIGSAWDRFSRHPLVKPK